MHTSNPPAYQLLTNDQVELIHRNVQLPGEALRYTRPGMRGLFGGIWRIGRTFLRRDLGNCFGPEIFYVFGENDREAEAAFETSRAVIMQREAEVAKAAFAHAQPTAARFGGDAFLTLIEDEGDRHLLQLFIPMENVMGQISPKEWFDLWSNLDVEFRGANKAAAEAAA
ncbi:MAG TPA: hypothetical protein VL069_07025 [Opitutus sp.]|nr:hypothetical protein [Opitutus sp.]